MKNGIDSQTHGHESLNVDEMKHNAEKFLELSRENGAEMVEKSVEMAKKYPVHTALGAGAVGIAAGFILGRLFR